MVAMTAGFGAAAVGVGEPENCATVRSNSRRTKARIAQNTGAFTGTVGLLDVAGISPSTPVSRLIGASSPDPVGPTSDVPPAAAALFPALATAPTTVSVTVAAPSATASTLVGFALAVTDSAL